MTCSFLNVLPAFRASLFHCTESHLRKVCMLHGLGDVTVYLFRICFDHFHIDWFHDIPVAMSENEELGETYTLYLK